MVLGERPPELEALIARRGTSCECQACGRNSVSTSTDESVDKLPFYASRGVEEVLVFDPESRVVKIYCLSSRKFVEATRSNLLGADAAMLRDAID
jgi:hypothetical protein